MSDLTLNGRIVNQYVYFKFKWDEIDAEIAKDMKKQCSAGDEFWMNFEDYHKCFIDTYICNITPDLDIVGKDEHLGMCVKNNIT